MNRDAAPERLLLVVTPVEAPGRYLFARWEDWPHPAMLALSPPHDDEGLTDAVASILHDSFGVQLDGSPLLGAERRPVRMAHPRFGGEGAGWLRAVAARCSGTAEAGAHLDAVADLDAEAAAAALSTDVERAVFRSGVALLGG